MMDRRLLMENFSNTFCQNICNKMEKDLLSFFHYIFMYVDFKSP